MDSVGDNGFGVFSIALDGETTIELLGVLVNLTSPVSIVHADDEIIIEINIQFRTNKSLMVEELELVEVWKLE